jgi:phosphate acetyltransferase
MGMFDKLLANLKAKRKTLVLTEGTDPRILSAADRLLREELMDIILCGNREDVLAAAKANGFDVSKATILDPLNYPGFDAMVSRMVEIRKGKMSVEQCTSSLRKSNYFGTMLVKMGLADALLGGATYSTADTVRPALQLIKTKPGSNLVSSVFILVREKDGKEERIAMGDCAINVRYEDTKDLETGEVKVSAARKLAEVAVESAKTARYFGIDPKVAVLSFSTYGSGKGGTVQLSHDAVIEARKMDPSLVIDGEFQFDAAVSEVVAKVKCPDSKVAGQANTFIFPLIEAGNIGYKIAQRLGGYEAYGPILQGLNAPINDLSRGCTAEEVYVMSIITAGMAE